MQLVRFHSRVSPMPNVNEINLLAQQLWPDAHRIDVIPGSAELARTNRSHKEDFRVRAIHSDGFIIGQIMAPDLESLQERVKARLLASQGH
jgi:hypothetical protein